MVAINTDETKNSLFGGLKKNFPPMDVPVLEEFAQTKENIATASFIDNRMPQKELINQQPVCNEASEQPAPKWQSFDKVTALLTTEQKEGLDRIAKKLMKFRSKQLSKKCDAERITANTLIRALISTFLEKENLFELDVLISENDVLAWVSKALENR